MGVVVQGTPSLFSSHEGVWGFGSSMWGDRNSVSQNNIVLVFSFLYIYFICGEPEMGYNIIHGKIIDITHQNYIYLIFFPKTS